MLNALAESGRRVPDDVSVAGFDDLRLFAFTSPPLTTIEQPAAEIAQLATELLIGLTRGKQAGKVRHLLEPLGRHCWELLAAIDERGAHSQLEAVAKARRWRIVDVEPRSFSP